MKLKRRNRTTRSRKKGRGTVKNKRLQRSKTRKCRNKSKKNYKGGGPTSEQIAEYTTLVKEIMGKDSQFNYILRTYYYELRDNPEYAGMSSMSPPTQSTKDKINQINLRLFCWIRDNIPGSTVVIPKGAILARTVSRMDINQMNVEMKDIDAYGGKPPKPAVFANTSQLANSTIEVKIPVDAVMFIKSTRKLIYLNLLPFQHLMQSIWKTRMDKANMNSSGVLNATLENITGISTNTFEWCNKGPLQQMGYDGLIQMDRAESIEKPTQTSMLDGYFPKDNNGRALHIRGRTKKVLGKDFFKLINKSMDVRAPDNQVNQGIIISGQIQNLQANEIYIFPEFMTYSYAGDLAYEVCDLQKEYEEWGFTTQAGVMPPGTENWPNNIGKINNDQFDQNGVRQLLERYELPLPDEIIQDANDPRFIKYYNDFLNYSNENPSGYFDNDGKWVDRSEDEFKRRQFTKYIGIKNAYGTNPNFKLYSIGLYEDKNFQNFGKATTQINHIEFNQRHLPTGPSVVSTNDYDKETYRQLMFGEPNPYTSTGLNQNLILDFIHWENLEKI